MDDLIRRQAALDALLQCRKHCIDPFDSYHIDIEDAEARIRRVPSAIDEQPTIESAQPEVIRCKECSHGRYDVFDRSLWCDLHPQMYVNENDFCSHAERRLDG